MVRRTSFINNGFSLINDEWLKWIYCEIKLWLNGFSAKHTFNWNRLNYCSNCGWTDLFGVAKQAQSRPRWYDVFILIKDGKMLKGHKTSFILEHYHLTQIVKNLHLWVDLQLTLTYFVQIVLCRQISSSMDRACLPPVRKGREVLSSNMW